MALTGSDIFLVGRSGANYTVTGTDLAAFIVPAGLPAQAGNPGDFLTTDGTNLSWAPVGGGGGGVTGITVNAPLTDTGTATAPILGVSAATTGAAGAVQLATAAEAATGTDAAKALTPATGVPKTPADMTGAALLPGGGDGGRPSPVKGMLRYNDQAGIPAVLEFYNGSGWVTVSTGGAPLNNVIYGTVGAYVGGVATVTHAAVDLAKSYIILNGIGNTSVAGPVIIQSRTSTSFDIFNTSGAPGGSSYFLIY